jgi:hypothetical protein
MKKRFGRAAMNPQTRSVIKAALIGLAATIALTAPNVMEHGRLEPIDPDNIFNPFILGHWVGALGWLPLIAVVITIAVTARKSGLRRSIFNLFGALVGLSLAIIIAVAVVAAVYPVNEFPLAAAGPDRDSYLKNAVASCFTNQRRWPGNIGASDEVISAYCSCYGNLTADLMTREDIQYFAKYGTQSAHMREVIASSYDKCAPGNKTNTR